MLQIGQSGEWAALETVYKLKRNNGHYISEPIQPPTHIYIYIYTYITLPTTLQSQQEKLPGGRRATRAARPVDVFVLPVIAMSRGALYVYLGALRGGFREI